MHVNPGTGLDAYAGDSVIDMSPQDTSRFTPNRVFRIEADIWDAFTEAAERSDPTVTRTDLVKTFMRWYARERGAKLPARPARRDVVGKK